MTHSLKKYPTLIPYLTVHNPRKAIQFYETAFGFQWEKDRKSVV